MIIPENISQPVPIRAKVSADDLATLIGAVSAANIIMFPEGKTLLNVVSLNLNILPKPGADGTAAMINAVIK